MTAGVLKCTSILAAMALGYLAVGGCSTAGLNRISGTAASSLREAGYVSIGGIDQWITITGTDRRNPVILFVHGGPGVATSPFAAAGYAGWDRDFTLVQWDQRGAGRTYSKNGESIEPTMTIDRITEDGLEVVEYVRKHLHKDKIILVGGSWGSVLGIRMAHAHPDLFAAYVGSPQVTDYQQMVAASYARVLQIAQTMNDQPSLDALAAIGPPPWASREKNMTYRKVMTTYQAQMTTVPTAPVVIAKEYEADFKPDGGVFRQAVDFSARHFWGPTLAGPATRVHVTSLTDFKVPIFFIHGSADLTAPPELTRAYFEVIRAPGKKLYLVPGAAHDPSSAAQNLLRDVLLTEVRPMAR